jgi:uncharacterized protein
MALTSLIALIDDIASVLDDVSAMSQVAAKKTSAVLGDDLALNAQQVAGVKAERELPVVWAVAKGSLLNKAILVPAALFISFFAPWAITPLLMLGGAYLCFEGFEKIAHRYLSSHDTHAEHSITETAPDEATQEQSKIKGAIRTDFILSAEIIVITLGTVKQAPFISQVAVVATIALVMTIGVYSLVAGIVKLDDVGLHLLQKTQRTRYADAQRWLGQKILVAAPVLMKTLSVLGTAAMFLVGGGILSHGIPPLHHLLEQLNIWLNQSPTGSVFALITPVFINAITGILAGALILFSLKLIQKVAK